MYQISAAIGKLDKSKAIADKDVERFDEGV